MLRVFWEGAVRLESRWHGRFTRLACDTIILARPFFKNTSSMWCTLYMRLASNARYDFRTHRTASKVVIIPIAMVSYRMPVTLLRKWAQRPKRANWKIKHNGTAAMRVPLKAFHFCTLAYAVPWISISIAFGVGVSARARVKEREGGGGRGEGYSRPNRLKY